MPRRFSPWNLVDRSASLVGELSLDELPRVKTVASSVEEGLSYEIQGGKDLLGNPSLAIQLKGQLTVTCERCLEGMPIPLECNSTLQLKTQVQAATRSGEHELTDDCDVLIVERDDKLDALDLLQDEILLALPLVPAHATIEECGEKVASLLSTQQTSNSGTNDEDKPSNKPFADLASLLGKAD
ncbi:MAG: YceD family protein [Gammaproteobacteria bacterium]|nr:YceD family protein [Gammaproteobacteria bacterium]